MNGLKQKYSDQIRFADLNFEDKNNQPLIDQFRVLGHPSFVILDKLGKVVKRWLGIVEVSELENALLLAIKS